MQRSAIPPATDVGALAARFDLFLIDQFGVLHDGSAPYPGAVDALIRLKAAGKAIALISNSGRRAESSIARLTALGFPRQAYDAFVSSGEVLWHRIAHDDPPARRDHPRRCFLVSRRRERSAVDGLGLTLVDDAADAELVVITGSDGDVRPLNAYRALLKPAAIRGVPCLCANPDKVLVLAEGTGYGAGCIAEAYAALGGPVSWIGKPYPEIYRFAVDEISGLHLTVASSERTVGVGDSIEHDVAGAKQRGYAAALVRAGIHVDDDPQVLAAEMSTHATPDFMLDRFVWHAETGA